MHDNQIFKKRYAERKKLNFHLLNMLYIKIYIIYIYCFKMQIHMLCTYGLSTPFDLSFKDILSSELLF